MKMKSLIPALSALLSYNALQAQSSASQEVVVIPQVKKVQVHSESVAKEKNTFRSVSDNRDAGNLRKTVRKIYGSYNKTKSTTEFEPRTKDGRIVISRDQ